MTGAVFKEEHQGQGNSKGADKEVQSNGITIGIFFNERQDQDLETEGTRNAGQLPEGQDFNDKEEDISSRAAKIVAQAIRPAPFMRPMKPTIEAAAIGDMPTTSCAIGDATDRRAIPQVILVKKSHQIA